MRRPVFKYCRRAASISFWTSRLLLSGVIAPPARGPDYRSVPPQSGTASSDWPGEGIPAEVPCKPVGWIPCRGGIARRRPYECGVRGIGSRTREHRIGCERSRGKNPRQVYFPLRQCPGKLETLPSHWMTTAHSACWYEPGNECRVMIQHVVLETQTDPEASRLPLTGNQL